MSSILTSGFIPREPEEISAEWLFEVINQYRAVKDLSPIRHADDLINCEIVERKTSHAYNSSTYIITVHFKCFTSLGMEQCKNTFFLKLLPSATIPGSDPGYKMTKTAKYFQREIEAHFRVLTQLKKFWSTNNQNGNLSWTSLDITTPEIVYGSYNASGDGVIVLQDVTQSAFCHIDHFQGLSLSQLVSTVEQLAVIHATASAILIDEKSESQFHFFLDDPKERTDVLSNEISTLLRLFGRFLKIVPGYREQSEMFEKSRATLVSMLSRSLKRPSSLPLRTAVHGELWDRNLLFRKRVTKQDYVNPHQAEINKVDFEPQFEEEDDEIQHLEVMFSDWKNLTLSTPSSDLALLLLSSTTRSMRDQHKRQILEKYYLCFCECLRQKFNINLSTAYPNFDFDTFMRDIDSSMFCGFLQAACLMTRELRFLETEFSFIKPEKVQEKEKAGFDLRYLGRRLLELADEFLPKLGSPEWKKILAQNSNIIVVKN